MNKKIYMRIPKLILLALVLLTGLNCDNSSSTQKDISTMKDSINLSQNNLDQASSPYLLQHKNNPVNWQEWSPELIKKAQEIDKPIIVSIGYAACHWCHVMEHESFQDPEVAEFMNENFIPVKVDREERPDIDYIYMQACQFITGSGGWPLNAFALPDGTPFMAGTYFPKEQWLDALKQMANVYKNQKARVVKQAEQISQQIESSSKITLNYDSDKSELDSILNVSGSSIVSNTDLKKGGLKGAPKFPMPVTYEFLMEYNFDETNSEAEKALDITLENMALGGLYDQIGGGFARYSVDSNWLVPHFEKMLYDNGQLLSLYAHAYQKDPRPVYENVIKGTVEFCTRELKHENGGFYSSLNADSEGEEGKFYVWNYEELSGLLTEEELDLATEYYNLTKSGNWEDGKNILNRNLSLSEFAKKHENVNDIRSLINSINTKLFNRRSERIRPSLDDKVLVSWNGLMIEGLVDAFRALGDENYLKLAEEAAIFIKENMVADNGQLYRNYRNGQASIPAFLDDYANLSSALIELYEVTFDKKWLDWSKSLLETTTDNFTDEKSYPYFYFREIGDSELTASQIERADNVIPSSNSTIAHVLHRIGSLYENDDFSKRAESMTMGMSSEMMQAGAYYSNWSSLGLRLKEAPYEIAIVGPSAQEKSLEMQKSYLPNTLFLGGEDENLPLLENKKIEGETWIYVCQNRVCQMPVQSVEKARSLMGK